MPSTTPRAAGPKPAVFVVERNFHATIATDTGPRELVLSLSVPYRLFKSLSAMSTDSALDDFERFVSEIGTPETAEILDTATDTIEVIAVAQLYFEEFQRQSDARMGELRGSSPS